MGRFVRRADREPDGEGTRVGPENSLGENAIRFGASGKGISDRFGIGMCRGLRDRRGTDGSVLRAPWLPDVRV